MPDPTDYDSWTPEDDDLVRSALLSLRADVDHLPIAPVETIKGRGGRRRRTAWITGGIGLAAAAAVIGTAALSGAYSSSPEVTAPATQSQTSIRTPSTPSTSAPPPSTTGTDDWHANTDWAALLKKPGLLPTAAEWQATLGLTSGVTTTESQVQTDLICGMTPGSGTAVTAQDVAVPGTDGPVGVQVDWIYPTDAAALEAANAMRAKLGACGTPKPTTVTQESTDAYSEHPMMWSFTDTDGNRGWLTVTDRGRHVAYVEFWGKTGAESMLTLDQFAWITNRVENRLELNGDTSAPGTVIAGPDTLTPPASLFIDPAAFASQVFTGGAATESGPGEFDGSSAVVPCDTDTDGTGEFGLLKIKLAGKDASYFATERVRVFADAAATDHAASALGAALTGCTKDIADNPVAVAAGPQAGTYTMTTTLGDGSTFTQFVAIAPTSDGTHLATLVVSPQQKVDQAAAVTELLRLRGLAAAR